MHIVSFVKNQKVNIKNDLNDIKEKKASYSCLQDTEGIWNYYKKIGANSWHLR